MHPSQDTLDRASTSILVFSTYNITENCSWPGWLPISDLQHPAWPWSRSRLGDCCLYRHQKSIHRSTSEISRLQHILGQEISAYEQGGEIQPLSDSYCIGDDSICTIIASPVEHSPQTQPASIGMEFKRPGEICMGKNSHLSAQLLKVIKRPLIPVIPHDGSFLLACILTWG